MRVLPLTCYITYKYTVARRMRHADGAGCCCPRWVSRLQTDGRRSVRCSTGAHRAPASAGRPTTTGGVLEAVVQQHYGAPTTTTPCWWRRRNPDSPCDQADHVANMPPFRAMPRAIVAHRRSSVWRTLGGSCGVGSLARCWTVVLRLAHPGEWELTRWVAGDPIRHRHRRALGHDSASPTAREQATLPGRPGGSTTCEGPAPSSNKRADTAPL